MQKPDVLIDPKHNAAPPRMTWREAFLARSLKRRFGPGTKGRLDLVLPSGFRLSLGESNAAPARLTLHSFDVVKQIALRGSLGPAEAYMRGAIDTPDLTAVLRFFRTNYDALDKMTSGLFAFRPRMPDIRWHRRRDNTLANAKRNIAAHYDLGNAFYALWLDPGMTYSSAIYRDERDTLSAAQDEKIRVVLDSLGDLSGKRLLEIGCGWGGLAEAAARRGAHVTGLTLSTEQLAFAQRRLADAGLAGQADLRLQDYRHCDGAFDAIASVEMIEAVGQAHWPVYFKALHDRLNPGGVATLQAITIDQAYFDSYSRQADFIQRYIFPGGMLPTTDIMRREAKANDMTFEIVETFGQSYATTLAEWRRRFEAAWPEIEKLGFDDRFRRMWLYYLSYCEVGFACGDIDVGVYRLKRA